MAKQNAQAKGSPFAHLLSLASRGRDARRAEEEDENREDAEAEDDEERAEDENDDPDAESDQEDGQAADDSDDPEAVEDEDDDGMNKAVHKAIAKERARCAAIFAVPAAAIRPDMAAHLAFETDMSAATAIATLNTAAAVRTATIPGRSRLEQRMATRREPRVGADGGTTSEQNFGAKMASVMAKVRGGNR